MSARRTIAALSTALTTAVAGLLAAPAVHAADVTLPSLDCQADSGSTTVLGSTIGTGDKITLTFTGCNSYTFTWSGDFSGTVGSKAETSPYSRTPSSQDTLELTATANPAIGSDVLVITDDNSTKTFTYQQPSPPWTNASPPDSTIGSSYSYTFDSGISGATYSKSSGDLPPGLTLSGATLSGTPTQVGNFTFDMQATDGTSTTTSGNVTVTISGSEIDKVTICHRTRATTNPYVVITVSVNSVITDGGNGHKHHNTTRTNSENPTNGTTNGSGPFIPTFDYQNNKKWWGDIIPPFTHSGGTFSGLNWSPDWDYPDPTGGNATWLEDSEFAAAVKANGNSSTSSIYYEAVEQCLDLANLAPSSKSNEISTPDDYFEVSIQNGESPESIRDDLAEQQALSMGSTAPASTPITIPTTTELEDTYAQNASVTTDAATGITRTTATLNGTLKANSNWNSWTFEWGTSESDVLQGNGTSQTDSTLGGQAGPVAPDYEITGLTCGTTYYFRISGTDNATPASTGIGLVQSFATSACPVSNPTVTTDAASGISRTSATLNGTLNTGTTWTSWAYEWDENSSTVSNGGGTSYTYDAATDPSSSIGAGPTTPAHEVTGLTCGTTYYFRVSGTDNAGTPTTVSGNVLSFETSACPGNGGGNGNSGGGNGNGNSGGTPAAQPTNPPGQTPTLGGGRPPRLTLPPSGPANRPVLPQTPGTSGTAGNSSGSNGTPGGTSSETDTENPGSTGGSGSTGTTANAVTTVYRPRALTPTRSVPPPPGTEWEPTQTRIQDPETGEPVLSVTTDAGTWSVDERSGEVTYEPTTGYAGTATVNIILSARSGEIYIHPMRVPISFTSRVRVESGDVPRDISGGVWRIIRPWQR